VVVASRANSSTLLPAVVVSVVCLIAITDETLPGWLYDQEF
jgi:hypothetical protein